MLPVAHHSRFSFSFEDMRLLLFILLITIASASTAQKRHFLYLQSDKQQAFYVKMDDEIYSSSASGFLILPRLQPGTVDCTIGFPRAQWPEHQFEVVLQSADKGMLLKNIPEKGWCLLDLQTAELAEGRRKQTIESAGPPAEKAKTNDGFAVILADAVGDQGIRDLELVKKTTTAATDLPTSQPSAALPNSATDTVLRSDTLRDVVPDSMSLASKVEKIGETRLAGFTGLLYIDQTGENKDTVDVSFEYPAADTLRILQADSFLVDTIRLVVPEKVVVSVAADTLKRGATKVADYLHSPAVALPDRNDCRTIATEKDMAATRKKAINLGTDSVMVDFFIRELKLKCYTVAMVQALSFAFVSDAARFTFFQEAYPWVIDPANYPQLERLFVSEPFISQFKKLINPE